MRNEISSPAPDQNHAVNSLRDGPLLEAHQLNFAYAAAPVVVDVSMALSRGAIGAVIGANGSGKSTLVRLLAGLLEPASGTVTFNGAPLAKLPARERAKRIAYVPQASATVFPFTALEIVLTGRSPYSGRFRFESQRDEQIALAALDTLDAAHLAARHVTELSGGERQLVTVARALAQEPEIMLLDEPASALDLKHQAGRVLLLRGEPALVVMAMHRLRVRRDLGPAREVGHGPPPRRRRGPRTSYPRGPQVRRLEPPGPSQSSVRRT